MKVLNLHKSTRKNKKYMADIEINGVVYKNVHFGDTRYQHFKDSTPLKLYSNLDHNDLTRKDNFYKRHANNDGPASLLSKKFLW
jgi:hypothetical protein